MRALRYPLLVLSILCQSCAANTDGRPTAGTGSSRAEAVAESATLAVNGEMLGQLLFERYQEGPAADSSASRNAIAIMTAKTNDSCGLSRDMVLIPASQVPFPVQQIHLKDRSSLLVYAIGKADDSQTVVLGPHYRFELAPDGTTLRSMVQSTTRCASLSRSALNGAPIDVRPAKAPTEFDVLVSLLHKAKLRVRTAMGVWDVDNGTIELIASDPAYRPATNTLIDCRLPDGAKITTTATACQGSGGTIIN
jgi:hypothetical protein